MLCSLPEDIQLQIISLLEWNQRAQLSLTNKAIQKIVWTTADSFADIHVRYKPSVIDYFAKHCSQFLRHLQVRTLESVLLDKKGRCLPHFSKILFKSCRYVRLLSAPGLLSRCPQRAYQVSANKVTIIAYLPINANFGTCKALWYIVAFTPFRVQWYLFDAAKGVKQRVSMIWLVKHMDSQQNLGINLGEQALISLASLSLQFAVKMNGIKFLWCLKLSPPIFEATPLQGFQVDKHEVFVGIIGSLAGLSNLQELQIWPQYGFEHYGWGRAQPPECALNLQAVRQLQSMTRLRFLASPSVFNSRLHHFTPESFCLSWNRENFVGPDLRSLNTLMRRVLRHACSSSVD